MLKRLGPSAVTAREADPDLLFPQKLEFNAPAHGVWNIVHVGMLLPEAHQIYVCAINCMRGVALTAAEMNLTRRFSCVVLKEEDLIEGTVEDVTLEGIRDVLRKLRDHGGLPPAVIVFPVCTHHFLGADMNRVYRELEQEFPSVDFVRAFMDPIMQKHGLPPDQRLRRAIYDPLPPCDPEEKTVAVLGCDFSLDDDCELRALLSSGGYALRDIQHCRSYAEYKTLSAAGTILSVFPGGKYGAEQTARRLGRPHLYLPMSFGYEEIRKSCRTLCSALGLPLPDYDREEAACEAALAGTKDTLGDAPVVIDATVHPRPLGLARLLLEHGFRVTEVYLDAVSGEETEDLSWLRENAPELTLSSTMLPELRVADRVRPEKTLAVGQKAAWFTSSPHFVNLVQGGGLWGYAGIRTMARMMREAWEQEQDTRDLIPRKGLGCESCI